MKQLSGNRRLYPSVVTYLGDWRQMVNDVGRLKLTDISLFLTGARFSERQQLYVALEKTAVRNIPHIHVRSDMKETELDYLIKRYSTKAFTTHFQYLKYFAKSKHKKILFIENNDGPHRIKNLNTLASYGGACIDLSHLEQFRRRQPDYYTLTAKTVKRYKVGCNHLSAVVKNGKSRHYATSYQELTYVAGIEKKYFSRYICLELANSIPEQLIFCNKLTQLLEKAWKK